MPASMVGGVTRVIVERDGDVFVLEGITTFRFETEGGQREVTAFGDTRRQFLSEPERYRVELVATSVRLQMEPQVDLEVVVEFGLSPPQPARAEPAAEKTVRQIRFNDGGGDDGGEGDDGEGPTR